MEATNRTGSHLIEIASDGTVRLYEKRGNQWATKKRNVSRQTAIDYDFDVTSETVKTIFDISKTP